MGDRWVGIGAGVAAVVVLASGSPAGARAPGTGLTGASIESISCVSAGNCTAVGSRTPIYQKALFVVSEKRGTWGPALTVPGVAALLGSGGSLAQFTGVSCSSAGNCGAGGFYVSGTAGTRGFVVGERNGVWGKARQVSGLAALSGGGPSMVLSVSCSSAGNCTAGGFDETSRGVGGGFVVSETHGKWGQARKVIGVTNPGVSQVTCVSPGNCLGVGIYGTTNGSYPFTVTQRNGTWAKARTFPRIIALARGKQAKITSVSCATLGDCTAVGYYTTLGPFDTVFAIRQQHGTWGKVVPIPGMNAVAPEISADDITIGSLSCPAQGNCTAGGQFADRDNPDQGQPYLVTQRNGTWEDAQLITGVAQLSVQSQFADFAAVACRSAGDCSAAGLYGTASGGEIYVTTERKWRWNTATELPGVATLPGKDPDSDPVLSCGAVGNCALGGSFFDYPHTRPYLATQKNGGWGSTQLVKGVRP